MGMDGNFVGGVPMGAVSSLKGLAAGEERKLVAPG